MKPKIHPTNSPSGAGRVHRLFRGVYGWGKDNLRSLKSLVNVFRYTSPAMDDIRAKIPPSKPRLLLGEEKWYSIRKWEIPRLEVAIMDGMAEHYGYPRHRAYLIVWWARKGYAWGVEYSATSQDQSQ